MSGRRGIAAAAPPRALLALLLLGAAGAAAAEKAHPWVSIGPQDFPADFTGRADGLRSLHAVERRNDGSVASCRVVESSGETRLDAEACRILTERALLVPADQFRDGRIYVLWHSRPAADAERGAPLRLYLASEGDRDDYPLEAVRAAPQGVVEYRIDVSATGLPTACTIVTSSGSGPLDGTTCDLAMRRARFIPASDGRAGRGPGIYRGRVRWQLPR